jgi:LysR family transcriptional regulator, cyn operon transcriptional activator
MLELRHLRYFLTVAELQHVTRAAATLHVTQSTLSHQIRQLEEQLGAVLFDRVGRGVRLTQAGELFRTFALRALAEVDAGKSALAELDSMARGTLHIGVIHTYNSTLVPPVVSRFAADYPGVRVVIDDLPASVIERDVAAGALDFGIAFAPATQAGLVVEPMFREELVLIVRRDHALGKRKSIAASSLARLPLALQTPRFSTRRLIDEAFGRWIGDGVHLEMSSIESLLNTVRLGEIGTIVSERAFVRDPELVKIRITGPTVVRKAAVLWSEERYRTVAARRFAQMFRAQCSAAR